MICNTFMMKVKLGCAQKKIAVPCHSARTTKIALNTFYSG
jgi:hypothetical protein